MNYILGYSIAENVTYMLCFHAVSDC